MNNPSTLRAGDHGAAVTVLQQRLTRAGFPVAATGWYDDATTAAVRAFQVARGLVVDGIAGDRTDHALLDMYSPRALTQASIDRAARDLACEPAAIHAVIEVESPHGGYLHDGRVVILFERHIFWRQLEAAGLDPASLGAPASVLSEQRGGYVGGAGEYQRLALAQRYGAEQAMESCSWGRFQIMGYHARALGYPDASAMAADFARGEGDQLAAFCRFIEHVQPELLKALQARKWAAFARGYNGPAYAENLYDTRLARAYARHKASIEVTA